MKEEATKKWNECLCLIRKKIGNEETFNTWFAPTVASSLQGNVLKLIVPGVMYRELYEKDYFPVISEALHSVFGADIMVKYLIPKRSPGNGAERETRKDAKSDAAHKPKIQETKKEPESTSQKAEWFMPQLNEALSFENYCVGESNKLPWTIAESISRQPVNSNFNPFFLYGDVGVGKTHLMQAIGLRVKAQFPDKKVVFLPMKEFQRLYQNAYFKNRIPDFLQWFSQCDVLLFDDLQEVASSPGTLNNALFPIFNHLHHYGKQLVFTCDRPPQNLEGIEERLIDRFKWGITEKLERPDSTLLKKILSFKAKKNNLDLPVSVIEYIASAHINSVREIEGVVLGIMTRAISMGREIDLGLAREVLSRYVASGPKNRVNFDMIVEAVAERLQLNSDVIFSRSRVRDVAEARMMIMYLAQKLLGLSTASIGRKLGRQHTTVIHGIQTVEERLKKDNEFTSLAEAIEKSL